MKSNKENIIEFRTDTVVDALILKDFLQDIVDGKIKKFGFYHNRRYFQIIDVIE